MREISIKGEENNRLIIRLFEVNTEFLSPFGGYDSNAEIEIKSKNYYVKGELLLNTGEIYKFYIELLNIYKDCFGIAEYKGLNTNLLLSIEIDKRGKVVIKGEFKESFYWDNSLTFEFESDQSYLSMTIEQLYGLYREFGDHKGKKK